MTNAEILKNLDTAWDILAASPDPQMLPALKFLGNHLENPRSFVTFAGETSSGKSTLINSLVGRQLLPTGVRPTTGTVVWLEFGTSEGGKFYAVNRDATVEDVTESQFQRLSEQPGDILRLKAELPSGGMKGLSVFDTPGFNSVISEHTEVLKDFLPESDVIVFVVNYRIGFGSSERNLMEMVCDVRERFGALPVIVVVNRAPEGATVEDKRIKEIKLNAEDTLHDKVQLEIVYSVIPESDDVGAVLPDTRCLWKRICEITSSEERAAMLTERFTITFSTLAENRLRELDSELAAAEAGDEAISKLETELRQFDSKEMEAYAVVDKYMEKISRELPKVFEHESESLFKKAKKEIFSSNKWVDVNSCAAYIYGHVLPFGTQKAVKEVERYLHNVFLRMDEELSEMANLAVRHLNDRAQTVENPELGKLLANLGLQIGTTLSKGGASVLMKSVGGVGGTAAGMGNLVKMGVKNAGKMFGKTFTREVYTNIGKIFTKKMVQTMSVCLQVVTELAFFVWEANRWQGELAGKVEKTVSEWRDEVLDSFSEEMVDEYRAENVATVKACYDEFRRQFEDQIKNLRHNYSEDDIKILYNKRAKLINILEGQES